MKMLRVYDAGLASSGWSGVIELEDSPGSIFCPYTLQVGRKTDAKQVSGPIDINPATLAAVIRENIRTFTQLGQSFNLAAAKKVLAMAEGKTDSPEATAPLVATVQHSQKGRKSRGKLPAFDGPKTPEEARQKAKACKPSKYLLALLDAPAYTIRVDALGDDRKNALSHVFYMWQKFGVGYEYVGADEIKLLFRS